MDQRISDFEINNLVRKELVIMRIDVNKLKYGTSAGCVFISGELRLQGGDKGERETAKLLKDMEARVGDIKGVRGVTVDISGWERTPGGQWVLGKGGGKAKATTEVPQTKAAPPKPKTEEVSIHNIASISKPCPNCNHQTAEGIKFCEDCGERLKLEQLIKPASKCTKCGIVFRGKQKFCGECGGPTAATEERTIIATCMKCGFMKHKSFKFCGECGKSMDEVAAVKSSAVKPSAFEQEPEEVEDPMEKELSELALKAKTQIDLSEDSDSEDKERKDRMLKFLGKK